MSRWRKEAAERLPELQQLVASREIDNPMMLWIELGLKFDRLCEQEPPPVDLLKRIWAYACWCSKHGHEEVATAATVAFCEHLLNHEATRRRLPLFMTRRDYQELHDVLLYFNSKAEIIESLRLFETSPAR